jgi:hypothetical protein
MWLSTPRGGRFAVQRPEPAVELLKVERTIELGQLTQVTCSYAWPSCVQKAARKDADPDIPIKKEAEVEYAKLK